MAYRISSLSRRKQYILCGQTKETQRAKKHMKTVIPPAIRKYKLSYDVMSTINLAEMKNTDRKHVQNCSL